MLPTKLSKRKYVSPTKLTKFMYPHVDVYVDYLKDKKIHIEEINSKIYYLNECPQYGKQTSFDHNLGIVLSLTCLISPIAGFYSPVAGIVLYICGRDTRPSKCREAEKEYLNFCSRLRE
jgi:hypothetical protein